MDLLTIAVFPFLHHSFSRRLSFTSVAHARLIQRPCFRLLSWGITKPPFPMTLSGRMGRPFLAKGAGLHLFR